MPTSEAGDYAGFTALARMLAKREAASSRDARSVCASATNSATIGAVMTAFGVGAVIAGRTSAKVAGKMGRTRTVVLGLTLAALADGLVFSRGTSLTITTVGVFMLGFGFMTAHSTLITIATEFAARARGTAMSLVTFAFMVGGAAGTQLGGRIAAASSYQTMCAVYGTGLLVLAHAALPVLRGVEPKSLGAAAHAV